MPKLDAPILAWLTSDAHARSGEWRHSARGCRSLLLGCSPLGGCNKPTSDNIQLWKTTEKGPEKLRDALADHGVAPRLRAEAAIAMVDIGRAEEVDTVLAALPADDRAEIAKTLVPAVRGRR